MKHILLLALTLAPTYFYSSDPTKNTLQLTPEQQIANHNEQVRRWRLITFGYMIMPSSDEASHAFPADSLSMNLSQKRSPDIAKIQEHRATVLKTRKKS
jgi:hypothetical protein